MTRVRSPRPLVLAPLAVTAAAALAGCGTTVVTSTPVSHTAPAAAPIASPVPSAVTPVAPSAASARADRLVRAAARHYASEVRGAVAHQDLHRIAADAGLRRLARSGSDPALRSYVQSRFASVWSHQHVSRLQILRGSRVLVDEGVPFVVDGPQTVLRSGSARSLTLRISIQDEIGFVRLMHRNYPVNVVVRGRRPGHVRASLTAALRVLLPDQGTVTIAGRRYLVRTLSRTALGGEPVKIWILARG